MRDFVKWNIAADAKLQLRVTQHLSCESWLRLLQGKITRAFRSAEITAVPPVTNIGRTFIA